ncbi:hypothetical protein D3C77_344480 [compost metagenome]|uniref:PilW family protein n=1 Tax=Pseudomonas TaxID=286 RepID=UPI000CFE1A21|nr:MULTISPECIES: hypothetical protein [unclassified Pseudomonas]MCW2269695.1 type IV pilus assembly protein PilW [Pseudomonas sp. JUb96]PRA58698.1 hypothetical protein CQ065_23595 [Pseudomonas sp. MYb187]
MSRQTGFSVLELLLALSLGLVMLLGGSRLFLAASQSWQAQAVAARMQEDARQALQHLARDLRMTGVFGCLRHDEIDFFDSGAAAEFARPLVLTQGAEGRLQQLGLIRAEGLYASGRPNWTLLTDCRTVASVQAGTGAPGVGQFALGIRRQVYRLAGDQLQLTSGAMTAVLLDGVGDMRVELLRSADLSVSGVRLSLTLVDPQHRVRPQTYQTSIALGNPVVGS